MAKRVAERTLYPAVERWLRRHFGCFRTAVNKGLRHSRIDIVGVRDTGGDLSGEVETIAIGVKRGSFPFANGCGQTLGYSVYPNRGDYRPREGGARLRVILRLVASVGIHRFGGVARSQPRRTRIGLTFNGPEGEAPRVTNVRQSH